MIAGSQFTYFITNDVKQLWFSQVLGYASNNNIIAKGDLPLLSLLTFLAVGMELTEHEILWVSLTPSQSIDLHMITQLQLNGLGIKGDTYECWLVFLKKTDYIRVLREMRHGHIFSWDGIAESQMNIMQVITEVNIIKLYSHLSAEGGFFCLHVNHKGLFFCWHETMISGRFLHVIAAAMFQFYLYQINFCPIPRATWAI